MCRFAYKIKFHLFCTLIPTFRQLQILEKLKLQKRDPNVSCSRRKKVLINTKMDLAAQQLRIIARTSCQKAIIKVEGHLLMTNAIK